jgi:hypothetical protein
MTECGGALRKLGSEAKSMEKAANKMVRPSMMARHSEMARHLWMTRYLYDHLIDKQTGERVCALVRFYKTYPYHRSSLSLKEG